MSFVSSIVGGLLSANAAGKASNAEVQGAQAAQKTSEKNQNAANDFQNGVWTGTQQNEQPYQTVGTTAAGGLNDLLKTGFQAPTLEQAEATPGYQFNAEQGRRAIDQDAAARGTLLSGNTGVALEKFGTGLAQNTYQQAYQNAVNTYMTNYNTLAGGAGIGEHATDTLASAGQAAAGNIAHTDLTAADQQMQQENNAAAARASGYLGKAAGYSNAVGGAIGGLQSLFMPGSKA